jgi:hypothetical protein
MGNLKESKIVLRSNFGRILNLTMYTHPVHNVPVQPASTYAAAMEAATTKVDWIELACRNLSEQISTFRPDLEPNRLYQLRSEFSTNGQYIVDTLLLLKGDLDALNAHLLLSSPPGQDSKEKNERRTAVQNLRPRLVSAMVPVQEAFDAFTFTFKHSMRMHFLDFDVSIMTFSSALDEGMDTFRAYMIRSAPGREEEIAGICQRISSIHFDYCQIRTAFMAINTALERVIHGIDTIPKLHEYDVIGDDGLTYKQRWWRNCAIGSVCFFGTLGIMVGIGVTR